MNGTNAAEKAAQLRAPIQLDGVTVQAKRVVLLNGGGDTATYAVTIGEGRNRQVRRMCAACGLGVVRLKRVAEGALELGSLKPGCWRPLREEELSGLLHD